MEGGCPGYPGASTAASQPLDRKTAPMAGKSPQPSHEPPFQAPVTLMKQWKEEKKGDGKGGRRRITAPQDNLAALADILNQLTLIS